MTDSHQNLTKGWKIAIIAAIVIAMAGAGSAAKKDKQDDRFHNHEDRFDKLEDTVPGNSIRPETQDGSHLKRIEVLELKIRKLEAAAQAEQPKPH